MLLVLLSRRIIVDGGQAACSEQSLAGRGVATKRLGVRLLEQLVRLLLLLMLLLLLLLRIDDHGREEVWDSLVRMQVLMVKVEVSTATAAAAANSASCPTLLLLILLLVAGCLR